MEECPVCGKSEYQEFEGCYDIDGFKKISPDVGRCRACCFQYQEDIRCSLIEQAKRYKKYLREAKND